MNAVTGVVLVLGVFSGVVHSADRVETSDGFQFIYHELHSLLLTVHNNTCYFSHVPDSQKHHMSDNGFWTILMIDVKNIIENFEQSKISPSTLESMRGAYSDLLATYRCSDKHVYTLEAFSIAPVQTTTTSTTSAAPTTTTSQKVIFQCSFENNEANGWCHMRQDTHDTFRWKRRHGPSPTTHTGPAYDHTFGDDHGHYGYTDDGNYNGWAALLTPILGARHVGNSYCLKFYYYMYGDNIGTLHIHVSHTDNPDANHLGSRVFQRTGNQGNEWKEASVDISTRGRFEIVFESLHDNGFEGDIAIDDIVLYEGHCF